MKLFIMFIFVALLAALCSAQAVDISVIKQPHPAKAPRFKRGFVVTGSCPPGSYRVKGLCVKESALEQPHPSKTPRFKRKIIPISACPPGYYRVHNRCFQEWGEE